MPSIKNLRLVHLQNIDTKILLKWLAYRMVQLMKYSCRSGVRGSNSIFVLLSCIRDSLIISKGGEVIPFLLLKTNFERAHDWVEQEYGFLSYDGNEFSYKNL